MERSHLDFEGFFDVVQETDDAQAAQMTLNSGESSGGPNDYHADSDQWLFVVNGTGIATVDGDEYRLDEGDLVVIEAGDRHEIENDGDEPPQTLDFYTPPRAY